MAILTNDLQKAEKKAQEYARIRIEEIMERSAKKDEWESRYKSLQEEQRILTSQYTEISAKYKSLIQNLDEQWNKIHEAKIKQREEVTNAFNLRLEETGRQREAETEALYQEYEMLSQQLNPEKSRLHSELTALNYRMQLCQKESFFAEEQEELKHRIQSYTGLHMSKKNRIENCQLIIKEITLQWEKELQDGNNEFNSRLSQLQQELQVLRPRVEELDTFLRNNKNSLQGWLKEHKKGWEETIGKLCDEGILWQTNLKPQVVDNSYTFYGISIDLDGIERHIKSIDDYQQEKENGEKRIREISTLMQHLQTEKEQLQERLKATYQPRIKEQKDIIAAQEYELEKLERQYQKDMLDLDTWKKKEETERQGKLELMKAEEQKLQLELQRIDDKLQNLNREKKDKLDLLKKNWTDQQQQLKTEKEKQLASIEQEDREERNRIGDEKEAYNQAMKQELHSQGADTEKLQQNALQLHTIEEELTFIKDHATQLIEYQKDRRELIDHIPEWQRGKEEQEQQLRQEKETLKKEAQILQTQIEKLEKEVQEANRNVHQLQTNLEAYRKIEFYEWYRPHQDIFKQENTEGGSPTTRSCTELIEELTKLNKQFNDLQKELHQHINAFVGHFGEDNTFKFQTKLNENWEYTRFAEDLQDFIDENRISEFIKRINNEHSDVFKRISMDTSMLTTSEADIHDLINKVNKGFQTCNFVGVIQRIEMKVEESSNRVVNSLRAIQKYYNEHVYDLAPGTTLFSSENEQLVKQEAIALLRDFIKEIHAYRYDSIRLYDSFELRFRIVENNNDTGFVEKLSNVGSEGTDILVKAMINIMLLYVFKEGASHKFKDFKLHCMMDEIGKLHPNNVNGILKFANDRNIILINGSPTELNREAYKHVYLLTKGAQSKTRIARLISDQQL